MSLAATKASAAAYASGWQSAVVEALTSWAAGSARKPLRSLCKVAGHLLLAGLELLDADLELLDLLPQSDRLSTAEFRGWR